jgi:hypothetical protein
MLLATKISQISQILSKPNSLATISKFILIIDILCDNIENMIELAPPDPLAPPLPSLRSFCIHLVEKSQIGPLIIYTSIYNVLKLKLKLLPSAYGKYKLI